MAYNGTHDLGVAVGDTDEAWEAWQHSIGDWETDTCAKELKGGGNGWICTLAKHHYGFCVAHDPDGRVLERKVAPKHLRLTEGL